MCTELRQRTKLAGETHLVPIDYQARSKGESINATSTDVDDLYR